MLTAGELKGHPFMGPVVRGSIPDLRSWPVKGFDVIRIYYLVVPGGIRVVRILHGGRNVRQILKLERLL